jgi:glucose-6-phosphate isomerase
VRVDAELTPEQEGLVASAAEQARADGVFDRIWQGDVTLWAPEGTPEIANRLGWLRVAEKTEGSLDEIEAFVDEVRGDGITDVVLLGMGGSSLAPEVYRLSNPETPPPPTLKLHVLDSTEPLQVLAVEREIDVATTLFVVSSKSGGTIEPNSLFKHFHGLQPDGRHFIAITDPGTHMGDVANEHGFRRTWINDPDIGGRYSALSYFGIVPAALAGVDVRAELSAAVAAQHASEDDSALRLGVMLGALANAGRDKLSFIVDPPFESFGLWVEQLIAESTGKQGKGVLPIADEPLTGNYGDDRVFVHIGTGQAPHVGDAPMLTIAPESLSALFFDWEFAVAALGWALGINPFDQPNVQEAKDNTNKVLAEQPEPPADGDLAELTEGLAAPSYVAIMGYLPYDEAIDEAVSRLRARLSETYGVATTWGYGPRFLHSTGQYHKGGPPTGRFLQLVHDDDTDADIPGEEYGFRTLIDAQADGDLQTIRDHGLPAVRVRLNAGDLAGSIDDLTGRL